jgi:hypothetical protein
MEKRILTFLEFELQFPSPISSFKLLTHALFNQESKIDVLCAETTK